MDDKEAVDRSKDIYKRKRPFLIDEGPTCVPKTASLAASPDYPSGHATWAIRRCRASYRRATVAREASSRSSTDVMGPFLRQ